MNRAAAEGRSERSPESVSNRRRDRSNGHLCSGRKPATVHESFHRYFVKERGCDPTEHHVTVDTDEDGENDVFDRDVDADNPKKEDREVRFQGQRFVIAAVVVAGLGLLALLALVPPVAYPWLGAYLLLATEYSAPPLRFKTTPFVDSVSNGLYVLPGVAAFAAVAGEAPPLLAVAGGWLWTMAMHTFSAVPDIEPDRAAGVRTTATVLGQDRTYAYCGLLWVLAAAAFWGIDFRLGVAMLLYPAFLAGIALSEVDVDRAYWWYPAVNTLVGMVLTMGKLWVMLYG
ncbi:lycopene elongase [Halobacteriales archaeon SW_7_71_33]|nr:MAG: lycopene elongase [Halobacteriales archaeon SW_7_71_33]